MGESSVYSGAPSPTLVFDAGSSSIRARLVSADGRIVSGASRPYAYASEPDGGDLARAFDLPGCWAALTDAAREVLEGGGAPPAIAVTSQRQSLVFLDDKERPLYAGPNTDLRAIFQGAALDVEHGDAIYRTTGHRPSFMMASGKLAWLRDTRPDAYARVAHVLPLADWIAWRLTGEIACEPSLAAASGLLDIRSRRWASALFAEIGLRCPETRLLDATKPRGVALDAEHGNDLPALAGLPVTVAGADTQRALIGMGVGADGDGGQAGIVAGWSATVQMTMTHPAMSESMKTWTGLFPASGLASDLWVMESGAGDMGNAWRWLAETLFGGERGYRDDRGNVYGEMDRLAASVSRGADGVSVSLGPQAMDVSALGMRLGGIVFPVPMTLGGTTRAQICRATLESFAYAIRANLEQAERESDVEATRVAFGGGLARSATLRRILPSVLGRPVTTFAEHDAAAAGAAGARAHGGVTAQPDAEMAVEYQDLYEMWSDAQERLGKLLG